MTVSNIPANGGVTQSNAVAAGGGRAPANLGDILERVLDKGLVIAGDIQVNLLDIELLTIKLRLVIASLETAREVGINWWEADPWLSADAARGQMAHRPGNGIGELRDEVRRLRGRVNELESGDGHRERHSS
jgi:gas vesicle protein GvpA/GvpJ/GvpM family